MTSSFQRILVFLFIASLCVSAYCMRLITFIETDMRSNDEVVYYNLGLQLQADIINYNTLAAKKWLPSLKKKSPAYFNQPLFKHPPVYFYLLVASFNLPGDDRGSRFFEAGSVSVLSAVLLIPIVYWLGTLLFSRVVGLLSAFFLYMDPISIFSSQRVWMDSTLVFFMVLSIYFFIYAWKSKKDSFFILSGIASGFAILVKYPGVLASIALFTYVLTTHRSLLTNRKVILSFIIPILMTLPWWYWNYTVYGAGSFPEFLRAHNLRFGYLPLIYFFGGVSLFFVIVRMIPAFPKIWPENTLSWQRTKKIVRVLLGTLFMLYFHQQIFLGWQFNVLPASSTHSGLFKHADRTFYIEKLLEYSFLYFFSFLSFFIGFRSSPCYIRLIQWSALVILVFYTAWGSYQSRYILGAIPFLVILAAAILEQIYIRLWQHPQLLIRFLGRGFLILSMLVIISRAYFINSHQTNEICYF